MPALRRLVGELSLPEYVTTLAGLAQAFAAAEKVLITTHWPLALPAYRKRLPALQQDLTALGAGWPNEPVASLSIADDWTALGWRYVLDGSSQGSVFIERRLQQQLPALFARGADHYWQVQQAAAADWPMLCAALSQPVTAAQQQAAVAGAQAAFAWFSDVFSPLVVD
jgi:heme oxygenase